MITTRRRVLVPTCELERSRPRQSLVCYFFPAPETPLRPVVKGGDSRFDQVDTTSGEHVTKLLSDINYF